jgi:uncharacterized membrane protein (UPF0127 family)
MDCHIEVADTPLRRLRGLLGRAALAPGEALLLPRTRSVHTWGMRFAIDAVFLDGDGCVIDVRTLRPWRIAAVRRARSVLELAAGEAARLGLRPGSSPASPGARGA